MASCRSRRDADVPPTIGGVAAGGRLGTNVEPVFYQAMPVEFYEDLASGLYLRDIIHLTPGDGSAAKAALKLQMNYFGMCFTDLHVTALYQHLKVWMLQQFQDPTTSFYQPAMVKSVPKLAPPAPKPDGKPDGKPDPLPSSSSDEDA